MTKNFDHVPLADAMFEDQDLVGSTFIGCYMPRASFSNCHLDGAQFIDCDMRNLRIHTATAHGATILRCDLQYARIEHSELSGARFQGGSLRNANLHKVDLSSCHWTDVKAGGMHATFTRFDRAQITGTELNGAELRMVHLGGAAIMRSACVWALFQESNLAGSSWTDVDFSGARMVGVDCEDTVFERSTIEGLGMCKVSGTPRREEQLMANQTEFGRLAFDDVKLGSVLFEVVRNDSLARLFDVLSSRLVLILGRFQPAASKERLDRMRAEVGRRGYMAVVVDWELHGQFNATTIVTAISMCSRFIIADVTDARTVIAEVREALALHPIPVQPLLLEGRREPPFIGWARADHYRQLLPTITYRDIDDLIGKLDDEIIPACESGLGYVQE